MVSLVPLSVQAWGRRGHSIVNTTAAYLLEEDQKGDFFGMHSFDLAYYGNVPDIVWKAPATYDQESKQHYMDKEIFDRAFEERKALATDQDPLALSRGDFEKKYPQVPVHAGRSFWRIREFEEGLEQTAVQLRGTSLSHEERFAQQGQWLLLAGLIGHYVGDLTQPLHVTENFDGAQSGQKGVHAYFEEQVVDALYPDIEKNVMDEARKEWPQFKKYHQKFSTLQLLEELQKNSHEDLKNVLALDKKIGRKDLKASARAYRELIQKRLVLGGLYLAEIWHRHLDWTPDNEKFYIFLHKPNYIPPGESGALPQKAKPI
jgi:hypothetical protein